MKRIHFTCILVAVILLTCATATAQTGYWQYVRTESYIAPYAAGTAYPDTHTGGEGNLNVVVTEPSVNPVPTLGSTFVWAPPPSILIPGVAPYWPVSATVTQSIPGRFLGISLTAEMFPYQPVSNLPTVSLWASTTYATVGTDWSMPIGKTVSYNNALAPAPEKMRAGGSSTWMDANGLMTLLLWVNGSSTYYWSYIYRWVPTAIGTCGGTCTLGSPGQNMNQTGGPGNVSLTATSTWAVSTSETWITITSPTTGTGNTNVTFTVAPNTSTGPRNGTILIGAQPYSVYQDGTGSSSTTPASGLDLHRPKLVVTDTSGTVYTLQPAPGKNDGTDDGSPNAGKDTGVLGQSSGGWPDHNFGKESPVYMETSTCNNSTGYSYLQFSLSTLPTQNISSAKVMIYAASSVVAGLSGITNDPVFAARRVTSSWDKSKMTWNTGQPNFDATVVDSQTLAGAGGNKNTVAAWLTYDVTSLYKGWAAGTTPNYGLRFSHENGQCLNGWIGQMYTSNDQPSAAQQAAACTYSLSLTNAAAAATGGSGAFTLNASAATCGWTASPSASWLHLVGNNSGTGSSAVLYSADANSSSARVGTITLSGSGQTLTFTVSQAGTGTGTGTGTTSSCTGTCTLSAPGQNAAATSSSSSFTVTATSAWTVVAVDSWIQVTSPGSNNGNGTVTFTVSANTLGPRTGTISVANQTFTIYQDGTPTNTTAGCAYLIQSSKVQSVPNTGTTSGLIQVITAQNCAWTASTSSTWVSLKSGTNSTGNGAVAYTVPANDSVNARSGGILVAGQYVVVNQAGGIPAPAPGTPVIAAGGVVNTASYAQGGPPNGSLAQGSFFSIYGSGVGPDTPAQATTYPLPTSLGGVSVQITSGTTKYNAPLVFVYKGQINAILPSNVPIGSAQVTVTYNSLTSQPATITVAKTSLGVFFQRVSGVDLAIAQNVNSATDYPLNLASTPAKPGQIVIFWATGMGPIPGADNTAPGAVGDMAGVPVTITVGGLNATRLYAGRQAETAAVDNIYFTIPSGVTYGCQVPVVITAGGAAANTTNIAITANGSPCQ